MEALAADIKTNALDVLTHRHTEGRYRVAPPEAYPDTARMAHSWQFAQQFWDDVEATIAAQDTTRAVELLSRREQDGYVDEGSELGEYGCHYR